MNRPALFKNMSHEERATLEMARRMGLTLQFWHLDGGWDDRAPSNHGAEFIPAGAYRIKPND